MYVRLSICLILVSALSLRTKNSPEMSFASRRVIQVPINVRIRVMARVMVRVKVMVRVGLDKESHTPIDETVCLYLFACRFFCSSSHSDCLPILFSAVSCHSFVGDFVCLGIGVLGDIFFVHNVHQHFFCTCLVLWLSRLVAVLSCLVVIFCLVIVLS
jgi:hypothetical protein